MFKGNGSESDVDMEGQDARGIATRNVGSAGSAGPGPISRQGSVDHLHAETAEATEVPGERLNHHRGIAEPPDPASVADYEGLLIKFHSLNKDLDEERRLHRRTKVDLQHKEQEADEIFKDWKQATIELNKLRAQGQFRWAGAKAAVAIANLGQVLEPHSQNVEAKCRYLRWKATTSALLDNDQIQGSDDSRRIEEMCKSLSPFSGSEVTHLVENLTRVVGEATDLDKAINKQAAEITWFSNCVGREFDPMWMEISPSSSHRDRGGYVRLVVAPGLKKRGTSTGEDFEIVNTLLKIEVVCEIGSMDSEGESLSSSIVYGKTFEDRKGEVLDATAHEVHGDKWQNHKPLGRSFFNHLLTG
ncbi:hypothetical protein SAPIO_CDS10372 [Scedosporium apiospermum]|uniref:Uncharacterized protein n=1 Tax=Pseudallescheria apiosperma TaxID=563466 RepID=A0A084FV95_PSEDA|nr:uncharacterized protein SAPIO_CDS10372 [Scedosporium apiospermum]KEZ39007.1 hypothetical protein SAPIO_CDS10372 [Scedosporium apiospermum]